MMPKSNFLLSFLGKAIIVHYEYQVDGEKLMGESLNSDFSLLSDKKKGDYVPIFVMRGKKKVPSCVVPKLEALRNHWAIEFE